MQTLKKRMEMAEAAASTLNVRVFGPDILGVVYAQDSEFKDVLEDIGIDSEEFYDALVDSVKRDYGELESGEEMMVSKYLEAIVVNASFQAMAAGATEPMDSHVLHAFESLKESNFVSLIVEMGGGEDAFFEVVDHYAHSDEEEEMAPVGSASTHKKKDESWKKYVVNISEEVKKHPEPFVGREAEISRTCQILCRAKKNNPVHVGEPGVGKTAITYGLAAKINAGDVPDNLRGSTLYSLDLGGAIAGSKYRGEFEERIKDVLEALEKTEKPILYIDEIHTIVGAGSASGSMDAANILKPYLTKGVIKFIGATTRDEYTKYFEKDKALARRFQGVDVEEPSEKDAITILMGIREWYENYHNVKYTDEAIVQAVKLSAKYISDRYLPDKAIDILDETGAEVNNLGLKNREVGVKNVERVISTICKIPTETVEVDEIGQLAVIEDSLKANVFGQDEAAEAISRAIKISRAGLSDDTKPVASFLFVGPTGVGKTEEAKTLADVLGVKLIRIDMSEYMEKHSVSKLIGAPAGYVGYEEEGILTGAIRKNPNCVLLLDEVEKAHPAVFDMLLQVLDYGTLTDSKGRKADFRNAIIILTSNAGASELSKKSIGFSSAAGPIVNSGAMRDAVKDAFRPEFRNRLSKVVEFNAMTIDMAKLVVKKELKKLSVKLSKKAVDATFSNSVIDYVVSKGYSPEFGAREISRVVDQEVKPVFVDEILFGKLRAGGKCTLTYTESDGFKISVKKAKKEPKEPVTII